MYTESMQIHTSVDNGAMKENRSGASFVGRLYRMEIPATVIYMSAQCTPVQTWASEHTTEVHTQTHEWSSEVNSSLPVGCDGEICDGQVCLLKHEVTQVPSTTKQASNGQSWQLPTASVDWVLISCECTICQDSFQGQAARKFTQKIEFKLFKAIYADHLLVFRIKDIL